MVTHKGLLEDCLSEIVSEKKAALRQSDVLEFSELNSSLDEVGGLDELKGWVRSRTAAFNPEARAFGLLRQKVCYYWAFKAAVSLCRQKPSRTFGSSLCLDLILVLYFLSPNTARKVLLDKQLKLQRVWLRWFVD